MPRTKSWLTRLPIIVESLEGSAAAGFSRIEVERIFQVSRSQATQLMAVAGAIKHGTGVDATVSRENLLFYLRNSHEAQDAMAEVARRKRLAVTIRKAADESALRAVQLPCTSADEWTRFHDLPNVTIRPGVFTVVFSDAIDLAAQLYRFSKAVGGEWDLFLKMCERENIEERVNAEGLKQKMA
jgi:hypothetical protein